MSFISRTNRSRTTTLIAGGAVILALGGGSATAASGLLTGKGIKDSSITGVDIKNGSLTDKEFSSKTRKALTGKMGATGPAGATGATGATGAAGPQGAPGAQGAQGAQGAKGDRGPSNAKAVTVAGSQAIGFNSTVEVLGGSLAAGSYVIQGKVTLTATNNVAGDPKCHLFTTVGEDLIQTIDTVQNLELTATGTPGDSREYVLMAGVKLDPATNGYGIKCESDGVQSLSATNRSLVAIQVDKLN